MFDPTIYENMKVVLEGVIYDLDLDGQIHITDRKDLVNLAIMAREYHCSFYVKDLLDSVSATIKLRASTEDLSGEILEVNQHPLGCELLIVFTVPIKEEHDTLSRIQSVLEQTWASRPSITQVVSYELGKNNTKTNMVSNVTLQFNRKINEDHLQDFPSLLVTTIDTLKKLSILTDSI